MLPLIHHPPISGVTGLCQHWAEGGVGPSEVSMTLGIACLSLQTAGREGKI